MAALLALACVFFSHIVLVDGTWKECTVTGAELSCIDSFPNFLVSKRVTKLSVWVNDKNMKNVPSNAFENFTHVQEIHMYGAGFREIDPAAFKGLEALVELDLERNKLGPTLKNNTFMHLGNLRKLNLGWNQISVISVHAFIGLHELRDLELSHNSLRMISRGTFSTLSKLKQLHMAGNSLVQLQDRVFEGLQGLNTLNLIHNHLSSASLATNVFAGVNPNLWGLMLDRNKITQFPAHVFAPISGLQVLSLSSNGLVALPSPWPGALESLYGLSFFNNSISRIPAGLFRGLNLTQVYGGGNRYHCDCALVWYWSWLNNVTTPGELSSYRCFGPPRLKKKRFVDLSESSFSSGDSCDQSTTKSYACELFNQVNLIMVMLLAFLATATTTTT